MASQAFKGFLLVFFWTCCLFDYLNRWIEIIVTAYAVIMEVQTLSFLEIRALMNQLGENLTLMMTWSQYGA